MAEHFGSLALPVGEFLALEVSVRTTSTMLTAMHLTVRHCRGEAGTAIRHCMIPHYTIIIPPRSTAPSLLGMLPRLKRTFTPLWSPGPL
jgi:hypothetical protein